MMDLHPLSSRLELTTYRTMRYFGLPALQLRVAAAFPVRRDLADRDHRTIGLPAERAPRF